ncbi:uncharacterized protein F4807DRAFT_440403 [Annulohypoxylon truncatum]|uniref:uncharacterized protein n=1 Tax=Annulohypoxylon truncatum TaxID=327061 RepID=UPI00200726F0|nr:uncharacterized protein F4807DRAFT_440403 [Annulohypoxylon truncatum]KAI1206231.1 hypothetical protein F4807DRAFT_440403 [Annulohypoxylon truncatum]
MEPKKVKSRQYFTDAMAKLEKAIQKMRISDRTTKGFSFNDLPDNIKQNIFEMVQSSPGWVHLIFEKGQLVGFDGGSREIYVNREWNQSPILRRGLSRSDQFNQLKNALSTKGTVDAGNGNRQLHHAGIIILRHRRWHSFTGNSIRSGHGKDL